MSIGATISLEDDYPDSPSGEAPAHAKALQQSGPAVEQQTGQRLCVVGSGTCFISGISYYTYYLSDALKETYDVSVVLMRRLLPRRFYPGRMRVGAPITELNTSTIVPTFDGVDWFAVPSLFRAGRFLRKQKPDIVVFQWWTGTVLHSFLYLLRVARRSGATIILEFHEDQDPGEAGLPLVERIVRPGLRHLVGAAHHYVVHSQWDQERIGDKFGLDPAHVSVVPLGPFLLPGDSQPKGRAPTRLRATDPAEDEITILFFGTIRPYKGLEDLVDAFDQLPRDEGQRWRLLVVGETWEGWELPGEKIRASPFAADIDFVNRYVTDAELPSFFDRADIVALPYHRSSASGPLHMTMHRGLPVVVTDVGGLSEAAADYSGAVFVPTADTGALAKGIVCASDLLSQDHADVHTWEESRRSFTALIEGVRPLPEATTGPTAGPSSTASDRPSRRGLTLQH